MKLHVSAHESHHQAYKYCTIKIKTVQLLINNSILYLLCVIDDYLYQFIIFTTHGDVPQKDSQLFLRAKLARAQTHTHEFINSEITLYI